MARDTEEQTPRDEAGSEPGVEVDTGAINWTAVIAFGFVVLMACFAAARIWGTAAH